MGRAIMNVEVPNLGNPGCFVIVQGRAGEEA